jgi:hypothetical protein
VLVREELNLPVGQLPECAPPDLVKAFCKAGTRSGTGPRVDRVVYNWRGGLSTCKWNKQASAILAEEYANLLKSGRVKHCDIVIPYDPKTTNVSALCKKIPERLQRTQFHWKQANDPDTLPQNTTDESDADGDGMTTMTAAEKAALRRTTKLRRRVRAHNV